ncbi:MAG TPA: hypothetical protein VF989_11055, partial [Polyangiaceae bacterium]
RRLRAIIVLLAGLSALLAGALAAVLLGRKPPRERAEPPATAPSVPRAAPPKACRVTARPRLLARNISLAVPLKLEAVADGKRVALGMAETATVAAGYTLDPDTLEAARAFTSDEGPEISGVTPLTSKQPLSFAVDRADSPLRWPTSIDTVPRTTVGVADAGFSRWTRGQTPRVLWRGDGAEPITTPRVARAPDGRFAVTFRRGGQDGSVLVGWLDRDGTARGELGRIGAGGRLVGTPAIAATASEILVAFASRGTETEPWHVELARAPHDRLPSAARRTPLPNAEHDAMSPALAALPDGRWLLQWTERLQAKYRVRVALLDSALEPLGRPLDVSPEGVDAGQGALWAGGARALSLYAVNEDQRQELWGVQLRCP